MYTQTCTGCATTFETPNLKRKKCRPECRKRDRSGRHEADRKYQNAKHKRERELHELNFIAVDGEGINVKDYVTAYDSSGEEFTLEQRTHQYVLLSVGDQSLHKGGRELTHHDIFPFLYGEFEKNPDAVFVGYFLGYDFTMWLKSLPARAAVELLTPDGQARRDNKTPGLPRYAVTDAETIEKDGKGRWQKIGARWEFDTIGMKRFALRPYIPWEKRPEVITTHKDGSQTARRVAPKWMYICDTGSFFQAAFTKTINPKDWKTPVVSPEEYATIVEGKKNRDVARFDETMIEYNLLENEVLSRLMARLNEGFVSDGIRLSRKSWYGPGQAAQAWMKLIEVPNGESVREAVPVWAREAARKTYYGGWFEIFNHGPVPGTSYNYDINSAYPAVIAELPCLLHGKWTKGVGKPGRLPTGAIRMICATFQGKDDWVGPVQYRDRRGGISRPLKTKGWHWWHEVKASQQAGLISGMAIHEWVTYEPCKCPPPMGAIRELYEGRLQAGKNTSAGKAKKLVYNSSYGKLAQSIGQPQYSNPIYASLITAGCRAAILRAIATHPTKSASLLMVATDGIVFKEPHPTLDLDKERLGAWDGDTYENLSLFMPGVYWHDEAREAIRRRAIPKLKSRGVAPKDLGKIIDRVDDLWTKLGPNLKFPEIVMRIEFAMVSAKLAISRRAWTTCGKVSHDSIRKLSGNVEAKRNPEILLSNHESWGGIRTTPYDDAEDLETTYYPETFGDPELVARPRFTTEIEDIEQVEELLTPDGVLGDVWTWDLMDVV